MDLGLGQKLLEIALPPLITAIAGIVTAILVQKLRQVGLDLDEKQQAKLKELLVSAAKAAEEQARRHGDMRGADKSDVAVAIVQAAKPKMSVPEIKLQLDTVLPDVRKQIEQPPALHAANR